MKKILITLGLTFLLAGCTEPDIIYVDKVTGEKIGVAHRAIKIDYYDPTSKSGHSYITCLDGVQYWDLGQRLAPRFSSDGKLHACHRGMTTHDLK